MQYLMPRLNCSVTSTSVLKYCLEKDSVEFAANAPKNYNYSYTWAPAHSSHMKQADIYGKMQRSQHIVTLK
jgi:hypothetical protein